MTARRGDNETPGHLSFLMVAISNIPRRTLVATTVIVVGWLIYSTWTTLAGASKFPGEFRPPGVSRMNAEVVLRFPPELFHIQILQDAGRMTQVVGRSVFLMDANVGALESIARRTWVDQVKPWDGKQVVR